MNGYYKDIEGIVGMKKENDEFNFDKIKHDLNYIYREFGEINQVEKLKEEAAEFLESHESEEIVDVWIVATQLILNNKKLQNIANSKIDRTLLRLADNYYT